MSNGPFLGFALWLTDQVYAATPRRVPSQDVLSNCKIISHRGEHDNINVFENTMEAFRLAFDAGAWGLETDIRWTKDLVPMIAHDPDTSRVFGQEITISEVTYAELRKKVPDVPTLDEFVQEYGGKSHLMVEIKDEVFPDPEKQKLILREIFSKLDPGTDFHFLALDPKLFEIFDIVPASACLPVALLNFKELSQVALSKGYAGISGHFLVLNNSMKEQHEVKGQMFATGFPTSRNAFFRELNRGIEFVFTNDAVKLLSLIDRYKR